MSRISIDVKRHLDDGEIDVTRLSGVAGVALVVEHDYDLSKGFHGIQFPITSIRIDTAAHAAIILAGLIAAVRDIDPTVVPLALQLSMFAGEPIFKRDIPRP